MSFNTKIMKALESAFLHKQKDIFTLMADKEWLKNLLSIQKKKIKDMPLRKMKLEEDILEL